MSIDRKAKTNQKCPNAFSVIGCHMAWKQIGKWFTLEKNEVRICVHSDIGSTLLFINSYACVLDSRCKAIFISLSFRAVGATANALWVEKRAQELNGTQHMSSMSNIDEWNAIQTQYIRRCSDFFCDCLIRQNAHEHYPSAQQKEKTKKMDSKMCVFQFERATRFTNRAPCAHMRSWLYARLSYMYSELH